MAAYNIISNKQLGQITSFNPNDFVVIATNQGIFRVQGKYFILKQDNVSFYSVFASTSSLYGYEDKQAKTLFPAVSTAIIANTKASIQNLSATVDIEYDKIYSNSGTLRVPQGSTSSNSVIISGAFGLILSACDISLTLGSRFLPTTFGALASNTQYLTLTSIAPTFANLVGYSFLDYRNSTSRSVSASNVAGTNSAVTGGRFAIGPGLSALSASSGTAGWTSTSYVSGISAIKDALAAGNYFSTRIYNADRASTIIITSIVSPFTVTSNLSGPRAYALAYNFTGSTTTYTVIVTGTGGGVFNLNNVNLAPEINTALAASPITIYPGNTAFIFFAPLSAINARYGAFTFVPNYATASSNDLQFTGYAYAMPSYILQAQLNTVANSAVNVYYNIRKPYQPAF